MIVETAIFNPQGTVPPSSLRP